MALSCTPISSALLRTSARFGSPSYPSSRCKVLADQFGQGLAERPGLVDPLADVGFVGLSALGRCAR